MSLLVEDGVNGDGGLAGLTVTNDEFALTATNRGHRVNRLDTGLHRLVHGLTAHDSGSLNFHTTLLNANERTLAVDGLTKCVHNATKNAFTNRNRQNFAGGLHGLTFFDAI